MGREAYRDGAADAQQFASPREFRYTRDDSYAQGYDDYMKEHPAWCRKCGEDAQEGTDMCVSCMASKGGGNDPETKKEE